MAPFPICLLSLTAQFKVCLLVSQVLFMLYILNTYKLNIICRDVKADFLERPPQLNTKELQKKRYFCFNTETFCFLSEVVWQVVVGCGRKLNVNYPVLGGGVSFAIGKQQHLLSFLKRRI